MSLNYLKEKNIFLRLRYSKLLPDIYWSLSFVILFAKVFYFLGLTTSMNGTWNYLLHPNFSLTLGIAFCFTLAYYSIALLFAGRRRLWFALALNIFLTLIMVADLMYYRGYTNFLSFYVLYQITNLENLGSSVISMFRPSDLFFIVDFTLAVPFFLYYKRFGEEVRKQRITFFSFFLLAVTSIFVAHYQYDIVEKGQNKIIFRICWTPMDTMRNLSPLGYHLYDLYVSLEENRSILLTKDQMMNIKSWLAANQEQPKNNKLQGVFEGQNLIFLQVESLENFVIKRTYANQELTPNLNRLLKNSIYFPNFYEQVWEGTTSDAELMANTSVYPVRRGSTFFRFPQTQYNSLPVLLNAKGYWTQAIHPDKGAYWNWKQALTSFGFNNTIDSTAFDIDEQIGIGLSDGSFLRQVVPIIEYTKQPFYNFMITMTNHGPFEIPMKYRVLKFDPIFDQTILGNYFQSVRYTDTQIGLFLETLDKKGLLDNTVVVLYGDHGGVHKFYSDELLQIQPQEKWWSDYDMKVPLIIYKKGLQPQAIYTSGGHIDILPTVAYLMGVDQERYQQTALGRNLFTTQKDFVVLADGSVIGKDAQDPEVIGHAPLGLRIADMVIQGNYFRTLNDKVDEKD